MQTAMLAFSFGYEFITKYDDRLAIAQDNAAAGINWGGNLIAMGLLISRAIATSNSLWVFLVWVGLGGLVVLLYRKVIDVLVLPEVDIEKSMESVDEQVGRGVRVSENTMSNWGVGLLAGVMKISLVTFLNTFLRGCEFEFIG